MGCVAAASFVTVGDNVGLTVAGTLVGVMSAAGEGAALGEGLVKPLQALKTSARLVKINTGSHLSAWFRIPWWPLNVELTSYRYPGCHDLYVPRL